MYESSSSIKKNSSHKKLSPWLLIALGVLFVGIAALAALELTNTTHFFHKQKAMSGVIPSAKPEPAKTPPTSDKTTDAPNTDPENPDQQQESPKQGDATTNPAPTGAAPITPSGNFVSNHSPNLGGSPAPSSEESVCNTTAGATCVIEFTNQDGIVKTLASQKTDVNGATYWTWDVGSAGFTAGTWKIKVTASLNGQTRTATDAQDLVVKP